MILFKTAKKFNVTLATIILLSQLMFFILVYQETCDPLVEAILQTVGVILLVFTTGIALHFYIKHKQKLHFFDWLVGASVCVYSIVYFSLFHILFVGRSGRKAIDDALYETANLVLYKTSQYLEFLVPALIALLIGGQIFYWLKSSVTLPLTSLRRLLNFIKVFLITSLFFWVTVNVIINGSWPTCEYERNQIPEFNTEAIE